MIEGAETPTVGPWTIPESWRWAKAGDVAVIVGGGTPSTTDPRNFDGGPIPWITPADLSGYSRKTIARGARSITEWGLAHSGAQLVPEGSVLFSSRAPIGYVAIAARQLSTNQGFKTFVLKPALSPDFVYYYLQRAKELAKGLASGTTFLELSKGKAETLPIPVAPLNEQRRIVDAIETRFARLDAAVRALERARANLKRYRGSILGAACSGRLVPTEAALSRRTGTPFESARDLVARLREERKRAREELGSRKDLVDASSVALPRLPLPEGWSWFPFVELAGRVTVGYVGPISEEHRDEGIALLRSQNVRPNRFDPTGISHVSSGFFNENRKCAVSPGDICIVRSGDVGTACVVPNYLGEALCSDLVLIQKPVGIVPKFGAYVLNSIARERVYKGTVGIGLPHYNTKSVASLPIPVPPLEEQRRIVDEVERELSVVVQAEAQVEHGLARSANLRSSILKAAFEGRLVPQDPNDEPASALLERLKTANQPSLKTARRAQRLLAAE